MKKNKIELDCYIAGVLEFEPKKMLFKSLDKDIFQLTKPLKIIPLYNEFTYKELELLGNLIMKNESRLKITLEAGDIRSEQ